MANFTESVVEDAALAWLESLGYAVKHGPDITPGGDTLTLTPSTSLRTGLSQRERETYSRQLVQKMQQLKSKGRQCAKNAYCRR